MLSSRIYKIIYKLAACLLLLFMTAGRLFALDLDLNKFLSEIPAIADGKNLEEIDEGLFKDAGVLYSLIILDLDAQDLEAEEIARNIALVKASHKLALYIGRSKLDKNKFEVDDALESALFNYYLNFIKGTERAADVINNKVFALAWLDADTVKQLENLDLNNKLFINNYLNNALEADSLSVEILDNIYLNFNLNLSSGNLIKMGRLYRAAGDKVKALNAFRLARKRYHEENRLK
ncbi:MAG: hypothetical protein IJG62_00375 [Synergistaceae bacterium]|nr:hypothetical protein [Synergistaceae bacterium]MBQ7569766.1 hypothetical protein [Synergistaceae bacterium]MBQ9582632.1 hypothetical protein [Synergistaceae bacterium]MBR0222410.1 hypothetical protein [Synergistaceae bacterium]